MKKAADELPAEQLRRVLPGCKTRSKAWCVKCGKECPISHTDVHRAGTPCVDHSTFNQNRQAFDGSKAKLFYLWVAFMFTVRPMVIFHENVTSFGEAELRDHLGKVYVIVRIVTFPSHLGSLKEL